MALLFGAFFWSPGAAKNQPTSYIIRKTGFLFWKNRIRDMLSPTIFRMVLDVEHDIVDVSRKIESLRHYVERAEAEGGDASYSRQALHFMQSTLLVLCEQRDHAAMAIRQTNKALTAASEMPPLPAMLQAPDVVGSALGVSPVGQPPTSDGCSQSLLI